MPDGVATMPMAKNQTGKTAALIPRFIPTAAKSRTAVQTGLKIMAGKASDFSSTKLPNDCKLTTFPAAIS
jgi:hypothetical protein